MSICWQQAMRIHQMFTCGSCVLFKNNIGKMRSVQTTVKYVNAQFKSPYWHTSLTARELASVPTNNLSRASQGLRVHCYMPSPQEKQEQHKKCLRIITWSSISSSLITKTPQLSKNGKTISNTQSVLQTVPSQGLPKASPQIPWILGNVHFPKTQN